MTGDSAALGAMRVRRVLRKWENYRTPEDGPPDEESEAIHWFEADGTLVTDPDRIRELEAAWAEQRRGKSCR